MQRKNGKLLFEPAGEVRIMEDELRVPGFTWNDRFLGWRAKYSIGGLRTDLGTYVPVMQLISGSMELYYFKRNRGKVYQEGKMPDNKMYKLDVSYNCYGYCFCDGQFFIEDPSLILLDEYEVTDRAEKAEKILLIGIMGVDDNGVETRGLVHAVNVNKNGSISYKPGVNALVTNKPLAQFPGQYNFNMPLYYKAKKKTILY